MWRLPWHPALFAAVIVLTLWLDAAVSPFAAARSLAVAVLLAVTLTAFASALTRSLALGAMVASAVIAVLWSRLLLSTVNEAVTRMGQLAIVWAVLIIAAAFVAYRIVRRTGSLTREGLTSLLNRAAFLLLVAGVLLGAFRGQLAALADDLGQGVGLADLASSGSEPSGRPDIFVILLDGYPRTDVLEYAFDLDNTPFTDALAERGFDVATDSHSDYLWTHVSVPSALNLAYVEQVAAMLDVIEGRAPRQPTLRTTVSDNVAFDVAREHGYTTIAVGAGFEEVAPRLADVYIDGGQLNEFELILLASTYAGDLISMVAPDFVSSQHRSRVLYNLDVLPDIAATRDRGPVLAYAHVPSPHAPVVFGTGGTPVDVRFDTHFYADSPLQRGETTEDFVQRYTAQLPFLNDRILAAIDGIVAASEEPPVIVLFADHGSASAVDWTVLNPADAELARLLERTGTMFAALTPEREDVFPDDVSPVDLFRLLFDAYFGTGYGRATPPESGGQIAPVDASVLNR